MGEKEVVRQRFRIYALFENKMSGLERRLRPSVRL